MRKPSELLRAYGQEGSESAFRELVEHYVHLVYSAALRKLGEHALAEDIVQQVFTDLAQEAASLSRRREVHPGGWLYQHTCFLAANALRSERRRQQRELEAVHMNAPGAETWKQLAPVLDDAIHELDESDRKAVVLRFFEGLHFRAIGAEFGISDDAAQKRVSRALDKLRDRLVRQGVTVGAAALAICLEHEAKAVAPINAARIAAHAMSKANHVPQIKRFFSRRVLYPLAALVCIGIFGPKIYSAFLVGRATPSKILSSRVPSSPDDGQARNRPGERDGSSNSNVTMAEENSLVEASNATTQILRLEIVTADSQQPIPNVPIEYVGASEKNDWDKKKFTSDRLGICKIPLAKDLKRLQLTTQKNGFADTRLEWEPAHGEAIPTNYVLRLDRGLWIGGRVVEAGNEHPIRGAEVVIGLEQASTQRKGAQSHQFVWITAKSDSEGLWQINRIPPDEWEHVFCYATHTNYIEDRINPLRGTTTAKQMRAGTHMFRLKPRFAVQGMVVNSDEKPIGGAKVWIGLGDDDDPKTVTAGDGTFRINGCETGTYGVSAEAEGYAEAKIDCKFFTNMPPIKLILLPAKPLRFRVVNKAGAAMTNASAYMRTAKMSNGGLDGTYYKKFTLDSEGRVVWTNAPQLEMLVEVQAKGQGLEAAWLRPGEAEHIFKLLPALVVRGTVRNDAGESIPRFHIVVGWPDPDSKPGVHWGMNESEWLTFSGGKYEHTFDERDINSLHSDGTANPGYVLKFEADGCKSFLSRLIAADEGEVQLDVTLERAEAQTIQVLTPEGAEAAGAEAALMMPGSYEIGISCGGFRRTGLRKQIRADEHGLLNLPPDDTLEKIIVVHPSGFVEVAPVELSKQKIIQLLEWGSIDGTFLSKGKPVAGRGLAVSKSDDFFYLENDATTDSDGHFHLSQVPAGHYTLSYGYTLPTGGRRGALSKSVEVRPGETTKVNLGDGGYTLTVHLHWPAELKRETNMVIIGSVTGALEASMQRMATAAFSSAPEDSIYFGLSFAGKRWTKLPPELQSTLQSANHYPFFASDDDTFVAEGVEPGSAVVTFVVPEPARSKREVAAAAAVAITIPAGPPDGTLDLGEIELKVVRVK